MRVKRESGTLAVSRRYEAARKGAGEYLRRYRCETQGLPSRPTWTNVWRGGQDAGGRQITVELVCATCRLERTVGLADADLMTSVFCENGFQCSMLVGVMCGDHMLLPRGSVHELLPAGTRESPSAMAGLRASMESRDEVSRDLGGSNDVEVVGFSTAAKQFYKARGPQLHIPAYRGEPSEVDLLAWKREIEKYFETYRVSRPREKVSLAADLPRRRSSKVVERALDVGPRLHHHNMGGIDREVKRKILAPRRRDASRRTVEEVAANWKCCQLC